MTRQHSTIRLAPGAILVLGLLATPLETKSAESQPKKPPKTVPENCTADGCHSEVTGFSVLHGPMTVGSCAACHRLTNAREHTFDLSRPRAKLCSFCHEMKKTKVTHEPLIEGTCLDCHDPHGGATKGLLRTETTQALCAECHESGGGQKRFRHGPVAAGGCMACHDPHGSEHAKLLPKEGRHLCLECHVTLGFRVERSRVVHQPVTEGCLSCHKAHASKEDGLLKVSARRLCLWCHEDIRTTVEHARTQHGALVEGRQCLNCHDPHASNFPRVLRDNPRTLCLECHNKPIETPKGTIADMSKILATGKSLHGPTAEDNCSACHQIHGGDMFRLLVKEYPAEFYAPFKEETYALCFGCHERSVVLVKRTEALTGFRNGDLNLHFAHVNQKKKGRTCRACHETHASDRAKHVRETVRFGEWDLPIGFTKTETGGACTPGCHASLAYDRLRPVRYESKSKEPSGRPPTQQEKGEKP